MKNWTRMAIVFLAVVTLLAGVGAAGILPKLKLSAHHNFRGAYLWTDQPTAPLNTPYNPAARWSYNFTGALNSVTRIATGRYTVTFPNLANRPGAGTNVGGNVQITTYGSGTVLCSTLGWESYIAPDVTVTVYCRSTSTGAATDNAFDALIIF